MLIDRRALIGENSANGPASCNDIDRVCNAQRMKSGLRTVTLKLRPSPTVGEINPFLQIAELLGFKPPIDVEQRLAAMLYMGGDDAVIHTMQVSVSSGLELTLAPRELTCAASSQRRDCPRGLG